MMNKFKLEEKSLDFSFNIRRVSMDSMYIHIPFCNRICTYCDFNKVLIKNQPVDDYIEALIQELSAYGDMTLKTIYVGGGTPTALNEAQLNRLLSYVTEHFKVTDEFTFEANPDELTTSKLDILKNYGVNRVSVGVQTFNNDLLKVLGRTHKKDDIFNSINHLEKIGLTNYSIDLMYNLPGETFDDIDMSLKYISELKPKHVSWYSLIIEPHTVFYNKIKAGKMSIAGSIEEGEKYDKVIHGLSALGYPQYEISNFATKVHESHHNKTYWLNEPYIGAGAGSHGYTGDVRYYNIKPVNHYINSMKDTGSVVKEELKLALKDKYEEEMFLGLRLNKGVSEQRFFDKYNTSIDSIYGKVLKELHANKLIKRESGFISLTEQGRMIGNDVFAEFLL